MFIARKAFKNNGVTYAVGSVISEPTAIKHLKARLAERVIIEVTEDNFDQFYGYFLTKFGVKIAPVQKDEHNEPLRVSATFKE